MYTICTPYQKKILTGSLRFRKMTLVEIIIQDSGGENGNISCLDNNIHSLEKTFFCGNSEIHASKFTGNLEKMFSNYQ